MLPMRGAQGNSQKMHSDHGWGTGLVSWTGGNKAYISVVFSWLLDKAMEEATRLWGQGYSVQLGGPAADFAGISTGQLVGVASRHNPSATRTSTGCIFNCDFCIVPKVEGYLQEKERWDALPIVYDNNLTACSRRHFDQVIDSLRLVDDVDINQGLSASLLTSYHASRLAELKLKCVRMAWDNINYESKFRSGFDILRGAGIPKSKIGVYVLIGFQGTPEDALYRLESVRALGVKPFPMRYQPLNTRERNLFVGDHWTNLELERFTHYWTNLRFVGNLPFKDFIYPIPKEFRERRRARRK